MSDFRGWMGMRPEPHKPAELTYPVEVRLCIMCEEPSTEIICEACHAVNMLTEQEQDAIMLSLDRQVAPLCHVKRL